MTPFHPHLPTDSDQFPEWNVFVGGGFLSGDAVDEADNVAVSIVSCEMVFRTGAFVILDDQ